MVMLGMNLIGAQTSISQVQPVSAIMVVNKFDLVQVMNSDLFTMMEPVNHHLGLTLINRKERVSPTPSG
jgi:Ni2+-binding GTPase involved in maturation of urease and hydrogenase